MPADRVTAAATSTEPARGAASGSLWLGIVVLAAVYTITGRVGLGLADIQDNATLIWAPTGLALATLVLFGRGLWPGVFAGAFLVNVSVGTGWLPSLGIGLGNTLEALVGATLLARIGFRPAFERVRDVASFAAIGVLGCTLISATIGVGTLLSTNSVAFTDAGPVWLVWWLGDVGGALVIAPALFVGFRGSPAWLQLLASRETVVVLVGLVGSAVVAFGGLLDGSSALLAAFVPFVFVTWAGSRLGPRGAVLASVLTSVIAAAGTATGHGPFVFEGTQAKLEVLWAYCAMMGAASLTLAAAIAERENAERRHRDEAEMRRRLESKIEHAQRLESLGLLAGSVAHDFNNILTSIRANAEMVGDMSLPGSDEWEMLDEIQTASDRAAALCERLLTYAGRGVPSLRAVCVSDLVAELRVLLKAALPKKVVLDESLSSRLSPIRGDAAKLQQVLMNLVLNGAEAIGDREGSVHLSADNVELSGGELESLMASEDAVPGAFIRISIRDSGEGMDPEVFRRIFEPFYTTKAKGRGLGLGMVLGIVQGHGGGLEVESRLGGGTTFRIYLPVCEAESASDEDEAAPNPAVGAIRTLLIADDEQGIRNSLERFMTQADFEVLLCRDGQQAVDTFREQGHRIDAVLLDVTMPRMSGIEAMEEIRARDARVPIILMSGYSDLPLGDVEPTAFVRKPFVANALLALIEHHISERALAPAWPGGSGTRSPA